MDCDLKYLIKGQYLRLIDCTEPAVTWMLSKTLFAPSGNATIRIYSPGGRSLNTYFPSIETNEFFDTAEPPCSAAITVEPTAGKPNGPATYPLMDPKPDL